MKWGPHFGRNTAEWRLVTAPSLKSEEKKTSYVRIRIALGSNTGTNTQALGFKKHQANKHHSGGF